MLSRDIWTTEHSKNTTASAAHAHSLQMHKNEGVIRAVVIIMLLGLMAV